MARMCVDGERFEAIRKRVEESVPGIIAEIGVWKGGVVEELASRFPSRTIYAYDIFEGLPEEKWSEYEKHHAGDFKDVEGVVENLSKITNVVVRKGLFPDTLGCETGFAVIHLDVDFYQSTLEALQAVMPRMAKGGVIILDDWEWKACPGVKRAVEELGLDAIETEVKLQAEIKF